MLISGTTRKAASDNTRQVPPATQYQVLIPNHSTSGPDTTIESGTMADATALSRVKTLPCISGETFDCKMAKMGPLAMGLKKPMIANPATAIQ